jgi:hypothetical protein
MSESAETRLDGGTLVVRIPMRFQRRGGRERIVASDGSELVPTTKPQPDGTLVKAPPRAGRRKRDPGVYTSIAEASVFVSVGAGPRIVASAAGAAPAVGRPGNGAQQVIDTRFVVTTATLFSITRIQAQSVRRGLLAIRQGKNVIGELLLRLRCQGAPCRAVLGPQGPSVHEIDLHLGRQAREASGECAMDLSSLASIEGRGLADFTEGEFQRLDVGVGGIASERPARPLREDIAVGRSRWCSFTREPARQCPALQPDLLRG